ncbi:MAG: TfoX/Sxy family protein [Propionibacteriaceae bacterium]|jgi:DNA transformation protein|nr:TfoX/Sxy family protein [Propionibacteriaceae bacterium]
MGSLSDLPNVGRVLEGNLIAVGVTTPEQLRELGAKEAFLRIRSQVDPGACIRLLYGIQGAVDGVPDTQLPAAVKQDLRAFLAGLEGAGQTGV